MTTLLESLESIKETLHAPDCWTQYSFATDEMGSEVNVNDPIATSFCLMGAVILADPDFDEGSTEVARALQNEIDKLYGDYATLTVFNDAYDVKHSDVIKVIDLAIDAAS